MLHLLARALVRTTLSRYAGYGGHGDQADDKKRQGLARDEFDAPRMGVTMTCSMVPISFSHIMAMLVSNMLMISFTKPKESKTRERVGGKTD